MSGETVLILQWQPGWQAPEGLGGRKDLASSGEWSSTNWPVGTSPALRPPARPPGLIFQLSWGPVSAPDGEGRETCPLVSPTSLSPLFSSKDPGARSSRAFFLSCFAAGPVEFRGGQARRGCHYVLQGMGVGAQLAHEKVVCAGAGHRLPRCRFARAVQWPTRSLVTRDENRLVIPEAER